jgi:hypothetical protein
MNPLYKYLEPYAPQVEAAPNQREPAEPALPLIIESIFRLEVNMQPLRQWLVPFNSLREGRGLGHAK